MGNKISSFPMTFLRLRIVEALNFHALLQRVCREDAAVYHKVLAISRQRSLKAASATHSQSEM